MWRQRCPVFLPWVVLCFWERNRKPYWKPRLWSYDLEEVMQPLYRSVSSHFSAPHTSHSTRGVKNNKGCFRNTIYKNTESLSSTPESKSHSVVSDSLWPHRLYSSWNFPGQNTGVGSLSLLQGIFPSQESNRGLCIAGEFFTSWVTREASTPETNKILLFGYITVKIPKNQMFE